MPLALGADVIVSFGILNKISSFYGLASMLTGHPITVMEWILNIWSLVLLSVFVVAYLAIRTRQGLAILAFAHFYLIDTLFSVAFTIFFCVKWFKVQKKSGFIEDVSGAVYAAISSRETIGNTSDDETLTGGAQNSVGTPEQVASIFSDSASLGQESAVSIILTVFILLVRIYFTFVIISYARQLVHQQNLRRYNGTPRGSWTATFQSVLLAPCEHFWTGSTSSSSSFSPLMNDRSFSNSTNADRVPLSDTKFEIDGEEGFSSPSSSQSELRLDS